jgi:integrase/recombinase XerD
MPAMAQPKRRTAASVFSSTPNQVMSRDRVQRARPTLRQILAYLCAEAIVCSPPLDGQSEIARTYRRYLNHLRQDCGLAKNSVLAYGPFIRNFLDSHSTGDGSVLPDAFDAVTIRDHFLAYSKRLGLRAGEIAAIELDGVRENSSFMARGEWSSMSGFHRR